MAHDLVSFALGTDTAGSGRVPAGFNNIVGVKPTRGLVSTRGLVPACRGLDCASVFAGTVADAWQVLEAMAGYDPDHALSRKAPGRALHRSVSAGTSFRFGVPSSLEFFGNAEYERLFDVARRELEALGGRPVPVDIEPLVAAGALLYGGPWVAERFAAVGEFIEEHAEDVHPVVRDIILSGKRPSAYELFGASTGSPSTGATPRTCSRSAKSCSSRRPAPSTRWTRCSPNRSSSTRTSAGTRTS